MTMKLFADMERRRRELELRDTEERKRKREQEIEEEEKASLEKEWQKNFEVSFNKPFLNSLLFVFIDTGIFNTLILSKFRLCI